MKAVSSSLAPAHETDTRIAWSVRLSITFVTIHWLSLRQRFARVSITYRLPLCLGAGRLYFFQINPGGTFRLPGDMYFLSPLAREPLSMGDRGRFRLACTRSYRS